MPKRKEDGAPTCTTPGCSFPAYAPDIYGGRCGACNRTHAEEGRHRIRRNDRLEAILAAIAAPTPKPRRRIRGRWKNTQRQPLYA